MSRSRAIRCHAANRARERLDHIPGPDIIERITRLLRRRARRPQAHPLPDVVFEHKPGRLGNRLIATVFIENRRYRLVYEPATNLIVTWLPLECGV
jgi:hypothetical protein